MSCDHYPTSENHEQIVEILTLNLHGDSKGFGIYNPKSEKVGTVWKTQIKKESSDF